MIRREAKLKWAMIPGCIQYLRLFDPDVAVWPASSTSFSLSSLPFSFSVLTLALELELEKTSVALRLSSSIS